MYSREESRQLRQEFWTAFGKSFPRKWILYDTKIKGLVLKFHFDNKKAMVSLDVEHPDLEHRIELWEKLESLKAIFKKDYSSNAIFKEYYVLENGKEISRIYIDLQNVSIHNKNNWHQVMIFLKETMDLFELFFRAYENIFSN